MLLLAILWIRILGFSASAIYSTAHDLTVGENASVNVDWQIADGLLRLGVQPGDKVAFIGSSLDFYWARLLRLHTVAEIGQQDLGYFWAADPSVKSQVINAFAGTGAKVIVTRDIPNHSSTDGWQKIGDTDHYAHLLPKS